MIVLLASALLSLMLPLRLPTGFVQLRPFEVLVALSFLVGVGTGRWRKIRTPPGLLLLIPHLLWHVISAMTADAMDGFREFLQVGVVSIFGYVVAQEAPRLDIARISRLLCWGMTGVMVYTILWHVGNGYWVSWKKLTDPRLVFVFLPISFAGLILFADREKQTKMLPAWASLAPLLLMSGERKSLMIYFFISALLLARGKLVPLVLGSVAGFGGLVILAAFVDDPYLQKQMHTLIDPGDTGQYEFVLETGQYMPGDTPSNVQRAFAVAISSEMIAENPLTGVGTNQFVKILNDEFQNLPEELRLGIHGEFQRVLTENGIIGLCFYLLIWGASWARFVRVLNRARRVGCITNSHSRILPLLLFFPCALFVGSEAPGTRAFVIIIIISLLPDITKCAFFGPPARKQSHVARPVALVRSAS